MARIRSVKPEFWVSEQVTSCSRDARLLFIGLWNFCDDGGVHTAEYKRLKSEVFPADNITDSEMKVLVSELIDIGLVRQYVVDEKSYWIVTGWRHQKINRPTPLKYPQPRNELRNTLEDSSNSQVRLTEDSLSVHKNNYGKGKEGNGKEEKICEVETSPGGFFSDSTSAGTQIFEHWKITMNHPRAKLDNKRCQAITKALNLGFSVDELKKAIDGCANTPFNMGENDRKQVYDDISLILGDAEHIERFTSNSNSMSLDSDEMDIMAGVL